MCKDNPHPHVHEEVEEDIEYAVHVMHGHDDAHSKGHGWHVHEDGTAHCHDDAHEEHHHEEIKTRTVDLAIPLLDKNDRIAERNRGFFRGKGILTLNLVSSPGAGKTTLLEKTLDEFGKQVKTAVLVGDLETDNDGRRLQRPYVSVAQITTGSACHLEAEMVAKGLDAIDLNGVKVLFIENVGNLVCPASFDLGEKLRVVLLSCTEGEDKPLKYPPIFKSADIVLLTKVDVADVLGFSRKLAVENIKKIAPQAQLIEVSSRSGEGLKSWYDAINKHLEKL
jgi:hydrogenase nickel incorporation protein HypB